MTDWLADSANWGLIIACGTALTAALIISLTVSIATGQVRRQIRRSGEDAVEQNQILLRTIAARDTVPNRVVSPEPQRVATAQVPAAPAAAPAVVPPSVPARTTPETAPPAFETRREARSDVTGSAVAEAHARSAALNYDPLNQ